MKIKKMFAFFILILAMGMMGFSGGRMAEAGQVYEEGNSMYDNISIIVKGPLKERDMTQLENKDDQPKTTPKFNIPDLSIDFEALRSINKDAAAWLYSPETAIDYPVMKADDYSYYLQHLPDGTKNANGALFIDYNNNFDFSDRLTVIYGHNMKSERMFGSLVGYKNQDYYEKHPVMYLYTEEEDYLIELVYGFVIGAGQWRARAFMYGVNAGELLAYAAHNTTFQSGIEIEYEDSDEEKIIALSTCSYEFDDARYVVIGILRPLSA